MAPRTYSIPVGSALPVISDTHGLLRPEVLSRLAGAPLILHAGDVGDAEALDRLRAIAPTVAVRGNVDRGGFAASLPVSDLVEINGRLVYLRHILQDIDLDPVAAEVSVVITGHSHTPSVQTRDGVLYLNPGSVGPRRFHLPIAMAFLRSGVDGFRAEPVEIPV